MDRNGQRQEIRSLLGAIAERDTLVIVEGKKDKKALEKLGITRVIELEAYHTLAEKITENEVVLLVDLDKEGKKIYGKLRDILGRRGIGVNDKLRHYLFKNTKLRQVEGLSTYINRYVLHPGFRPPR